MDFKLLGIGNNSSGASSRGVAASFGGASRTATSPSENPFASGSKLFSQNTAGVNTNFNVGDKMFIAAQAGRQAGSGRILGVA